MPYYKTRPLVRLSHGPPQTVKIARELARSLSGGMLVSLTGPVGAGKTTLVKALARALGVKAIVTSPSFVLLNRYRLPGKPARWFIHVDGYRLSSYAELADLGLGEFLGNPKYLVVVEWPKGKKKDWPRVPGYNIKIQPLCLTGRRFKISSQRS
ncbi:MAG: tRNA (adenosine(37)-N6)-threonylcarbamoyltransferase complex ATPase subunit type 1 TsaE [bacterium]